MGFYTMNVLEVDAVVSCHLLANVSQPAFFSHLVYYEHTTCHVPESFELLSYTTAFLRSSWTLFFHL